MASELKFDRKYILTVDLNDGTQLYIDYSVNPFTIEFEIFRKLMAAPSHCQIRLYNISEHNRNLLAYDFSNFKPSKRVVSLRAGYGTNLPIIFYGTVTQCWSVREGNNFITTIESFDGGVSYTNGEIPATQTFPKGMLWKDLFETIMGKGYPAETNPYLPGTTFGAIGKNFITDEQGNLTRLTKSEPATGNTVKYLRSRVADAFFIDNGKSFILGDPECRKGTIALIDSSTGLLGTPQKENSILSFDILFEPSLVVGQKVFLQSTTLSGANSSINGAYKINSIKHRGTISPTVCGSVITSIEIVFGPQALVEVTDQ